MSGRERCIVRPVGNSIQYNNAIFPAMTLLKSTEMFCELGFGRDGLRCATSLCAGLTVLISRDEC